MEPSRIAVLGAGTMGPGIAAAFVAAGFPTSMWARRPSAARDGAVAAERMRADLVEHGLATSNAVSVQHSDDLEEALDRVDLAVEAISESLEAKRDLFARVEAFVDPTVLLASSTTGLDIDQIARGATHHERCLVMHFWNPAHLVPLVEVLGSSSATVEVLDVAAGLLRAIGKHPVVLRKYVPGFLGARLQQAVVREALALLDAGVASAEDIDAVTRLSFGARFPVLGPLETSDLGGLDVLAAIHEYLLPDLDCSREIQAPLRRAISASNLGVKSGSGFYDWRSRDAKELVRRRDEELISRVKALRQRGELGGG